MASPNTAGQKKQKSSDPRISPFADLMMASTPPAESSSGRNQPPFHVFINHCGQDTKHTLADTIYKKLNVTGLRVFLDKDEIERGDFFPKILENAISNASMHIAIFSENYVKSPWCLAELTSMLQTSAKFIPIFYHIEPSILRWGFKKKGIYANDFYQHEKKNRYSTEMLESWKSALHKASFYNGKIINNQCDEEKAVMNVVNHVLKELKTMRLDVTQHPVGLDETEQDFHNIALQSTGPIQIIGIWGMGGAGKTTLAKHIYNKKCSLFHKSSFLLDVREAAFKGRLHKKQKKLLQDLKGETANFDNIDEGKAILRKCLESVSVLIVLDDVNHKDQLDAMLPAKNNLGHGSLIIVTTRELDVLRAWDIFAIYKIRTLDPSYAKELFCWHAFGQPSPFIDFKELTEQFIDACCGLPLSLKVLGGLLHGEKRKEYWKYQLDKLSRIVPDDIKSKLKISYDALDDEEKDMFLDVACFFIGWTSNSAIAVWDGSQWSGLLGWQRLVNKCLVDELEEDNNIIRMHDHLRDLGREIANKQSPYRLWVRRQSIEIQPQQEAIRMRGMADAFGDNCYLRHAKIILNTTQGERILAPGSLGLRIFIGEGDFINEECSELSRELLCFRCFRFAHKNLPSWLPLKKLRILELVAPQKLEVLWECDEHAPLQLRQLLIRHGYGLKKISGLQRLRSLETLVIDDCTELNTLPSLAEITSLKKIDLHGCNKLEKIESLEGLRSLETLKIHYCKELNTLPSLAELTSLKEIDLKWCNKLEKIESLEGLRFLETLKIHYCPELNTLPSLAELTSLKEIDLSDCSKLEEIESLEGLRALEILTMHACQGLNTLPSLLDTTSLKEIDLSECSKLEKIESLKGLRSLETLKMHYCRELNTLPSLADTTSLKEIDLSKCSKLEKIESLKGLRSLETLKICYCAELKTLPGFAELTSLKKIDLSECRKLEKIESLEGLRALETLNIDYCTELNILPGLGNTTSLKEIDLNGFSKLEKIESLESLRSLETLTMHDCTELNTLPGLAKLTSLKEVYLSNWTKLEKIESLEGLRSLETLTMQNCIELNTLPGLGELTSLKDIFLSGCSKLEKIENLEGLRSLERLTMYTCIELNTLCLAELTSLKDIVLSCCSKLEKIESLEGLRSLERLTMHNCTELNTLPGLAKLTSLKEIFLSGCSKLEKIESLEGLRSLERLEINYCAELNTLSGLAELTSLKEIDLSFCSKLEKIEGIEGLRSLEILRIDGCRELKTIPSLAELTCLEQFKLIGCEKVDKVEGLEVLRSLEKMEVHMCSMMPCILKLPEQSERLKSVVVVANRLGVVEPSIREIQKWPWEEIICTRAVIGVMSLRNFFTSSLPDDVVQTYSGLRGWVGITLRMPESAILSANANANAILSANAILICFVIRSSYPNVSLNIYTDRNNSFHSSGMSNGERLGRDIFGQESIWVWMGNFPEESDWLHSERYKIMPESATFGGVEVEEAWLLKGTEQSIREAFHHLICQRRPVSFPDPRPERRFCLRFWPSCLGG